MSKYMTKEEIFNRIKTCFETIEVPVDELGKGTIFKLKALSGADYDNYQRMLSDKTGPSGISDTSEMRPFALQMSIIDEEGNLLFSKDDIAKINELPSTVLDRIFVEMAKLNGMDEAALEQAEKNLDVIGGNKNGSV